MCVVSSGASIDAALSRCCTAPGRASGLRLGAGQSREHRGQGPGIRRWDRPGGLGCVTANIEGMERVVVRALLCCFPCMSCESMWCGTVRQTDGVTARQTDVEADMEADRTGDVEIDKEGDKRTGRQTDEQIGVSQIERS